LFSIVSLNGVFRVLYERVLSEEADKMESVWNKYLDFECHVGDLTSILKVENRRLERVLRPREDELLGDGPKEKRNESALLIDRYRFLDLFPCTREELRSMGYKDAGSLMSELIVSVHFRFQNRGDSSATFSHLRRKRQKRRTKC
jgi:hypothetical protein